MNFEGPRGAQAKEWVQSHLLSCIQEEPKARTQEGSKEMAGGDIGNDFLFIPPLSRESLPTWLKSQGI